MFELTGKQTLESKQTNSRNDVLDKRNFDLFASIDSVPPSLPISYGRARLYLSDDKHTVIKMCSQRVDLDRDPSVYLKFVGKRDQLVVILPKTLFYRRSLGHIVRTLFNYAP